MNSTVFVKTYDAPDFNISEILRYLRCDEKGEEFIPLVNECIEECRGKLVYKVCYCELPVNHTDDGTELGFIKIQSKHLAKNLKNCKSAVLFGATVGIEIDRLISKYGRLAPSKALIFQAIGAERIESLCDVFNEEIKSVKDKNFTTPRFSPGYGDFSLNHQKDIFRVLDCYRKIGLSLNDSLMMSPTKSVTAIIGISDTCDNKNSNPCGRCSKTDCEFRSRG